MYTIQKKYAACCSHVLEGLPDGHPCGRLHGHNYEFEFVIESERLNEVGFVVDYREMDRIVKPLVDDVLDHHHLNGIPALSGRNPSAENIASWLFAKVGPQLLPAKLVAVRVSETPKTWAEYRWEG